MLNPFYWYSLIWTVVYLLYSLGYSYINKPLVEELNLFFIFTIIFSYFIGFLTKNMFKYRELTEEEYNYKGRFVYLIILFAILDIVYMRQIPLLSILSKSSVYGNEELLGMPLIHSLNTNIIIFYATYSFYILLETKNKKALRNIILSVLVLGSMFQKGIIIILFFAIFNTYVAKVRLSYNRRKIRRIIPFLVVGALLLVYLNGGVSNIRSGYTWNDSEYISRVSQIIDWPSYLPGQYKWAYSYITTPLGNLNNILKIYNHVNSSGFFDINYNQVLGTIIPITIAKQLFPQTILNIDVKDWVEVSYMNASSGFANVATVSGVYGLIIFYILIMSVTLAVSFYCRRSRDLRVVTNAILTSMIAFLFFYNTFYTAALSLLPLIIVFNKYLRKFTFKF